MKIIATTAFFCLAATAVEARQYCFYNTTNAAVADWQNTRCYSSRKEAVRARRAFQGAVPDRDRRSSIGTGGLVSALAAKAQEIVNSCGSVIISSVRHTRVRGSGRMSLHASGRAVDIRGNPSCVYSHLAGWPGGMSTDYGRVKHVHISYDPGGREWGMRFAHGGRSARTKARRR